MNIKWKSIVPTSFHVPYKYKTDKFFIYQLTVNDIDEDYDAVMSSVDYLKGTFDFLPDWPSKEMSKTEDLSNLGWHQTEFGLKTSFAYKVRNKPNNEYIGCVYIFPSNNQNYEVDVYTWVKESYKNFDKQLYKQIKEWMYNTWPFKKVLFPGR